MSGGRLSNSVTTDTRLLAKNAGPDKLMMIQSIGQPRPPAPGVPCASVVIPVGRDWRFVDAQLAALAAQDGAPTFEIVVALNDEGALAWSREKQVVPNSTDLSTQPRRLFIDATERRSPGFARNVGARAATAGKLLFCDADDEVSPTWVATLVAALDEADLATGPLDLDRLNPPRLAETRGKRWAAEPATFLGTFPVASGCSLAIRRDAFEVLGGFNETVQPVEDIDLCYRAFQAGMRFEFEPTASISYRLRDRALSMVRQGFLYGRGHTRIARRMQADGLSAAEHSGLVRRWIWLARKVLWLASAERRSRWLWTASVAAGQLAGRWAPPILPLRRAATACAALTASGGVARG